MEDEDSRWHRSEQCFLQKEGLLKDPVSYTRRISELGLERSFKLVKRSHRSQGLDHNESLED